MQRIIDTTATGTIPTVPVLSGTTGFFTEGVPGITAPTRVRGWWVNMVQEELLSLLTAAGITPDTAGTNFTQVLQAIQSLGRIKLTSNVTLFVANSGSDVTGGLTSNFQTLQRAINFVYDSLDLNNFVVTISLAANTFTGSGTIAGRPVGASQKNIPILITGVAPGATIISVTNDNAITVSQGAVVQLSNLTLAATGTGSLTGNAVVGNNAGYCNLGTGITFGACSGAHMLALSGSTIVSQGNPYTVSGSAAYHVSANLTGIVSTVGSAVTLTGTPAFSTAFAAATLGGILEVFTQTFAGTASGVRYAISGNGVITTNGGGATYLPGSVAGTANTGGQYI